MANARTRRNYALKGIAYAAQGQRTHPDVTPLEALCRHAEDRTNILKPSSVRSYWQQYARAVVKLGHDGGLGKPEMRDALGRIRTALERLKGKPTEPRTSSKKVKDPHDWMVRQVFGHLKHSAVRHGRIRSAACALYCLLVPKLGTRPVELVGAWVDGNVLHVPTAKQAGDESPVRQIDISAFHPTHRAALVALIDIVADDVRDAGYDAWLKTLAEILARACEAASAKSDHTIPRLAPSSFRHTAISTWHAAGYSPEEIAELAGHRHVRSQSHYRRASSAWQPTKDLAKPVTRPLSTVPPARPNAPRPATTPKTARSRPSSDAVDVAPVRGDPGFIDVTTDDQARWSFSPRR